MLSDLVSQLRRAVERQPCLVTLTIVVFGLALLGRGMRPCLGETLCEEELSCALSE